MENNVYTAWDGKQYQGPPPEGWYQASDDRWWPEGYGPRPSPPTPGTDYQVNDQQAATAGSATATVIDNPVLDTPALDSPALDDVGFDDAPELEAEDEPVFGFTDGSVGDVVDEATDTMGDAAEAVEDSASDAAESAVDEVSDGVSGLGGLAGAAAAGAAGMAAAGTTDVGSKASDLLNRLKGTDEAQEAVSGASAEVTDQIGDVTSGLSDRVGALGDMPAALAGTAPSVDIPAFEAPSIDAPSFEAPSIEVPSIDGPDLGGVDEAVGRVESLADVPEGPLAEALDADPVDMSAPGMDNPTLDIPRVNLDDPNFDPATLSPSFAGPGPDDTSEVAVVDAAGETMFTGERMPDPFPPPPGAGPAPEAADATNLLGAEPPPPADTRADTRADPDYGVPTYSAPPPQGPAGGPAMAESPGFSDPDYYPSSNDLQAGLAPQRRSRLLPIIGAIVGLILAGIVGYMAYGFFNDDDGDTGDTTEADGDTTATTSAVAGSLSNPHPATRPVSVFWDTDAGVEQKWLIQPEAVAEETVAAINGADNDDAKSYAATRLLILNQAGADNAELGELRFGAAATNGTIYDPVDCPAGVALPGGTVALSQQVEGVVCWMVDDADLDGLMLGIRSTEVPGTIHVALP